MFVLVFLLSIFSSDRSTREQRASRAGEGSQYAGTTIRRVLLNYACVFTTVRARMSYLDWCTCIGGGLFFCRFHFRDMSSHSRSSRSVCVSLRARVLSMYSCLTLSLAAVRARRGVGSAGRPSGQSRVV